MALRICRRGWCFLGKALFRLSFCHSLEGNILDFFPVLSLVSSRRDAVAPAGLISCWLCSVQTLHEVVNQENAAKHFL